VFASAFTPRKEHIFDVFPIRADWQFLHNKRTPLPGPVKDQDIGAALQRSISNTEEQLLTRAAVTTLYTSRFYAARYSNRV